MPNKNYTILLIPEGSHKVRRYMIGRKWLYSVAATFSLVLLLGGFLSLDYFRTNVDRSELKRLRVQNQLQHNELREFANRLEDVRKEMVILAQNDAKMRAQAQISHPSGTPENIQVGIGGPLESAPASDMSNLQQQIDQIRASIDLRRESQEEVRGFLTEQSSLLSSKPNGLPARGWLTSNFGIRNSPFSGKRTMHEGIDIAARIGTPVYATAAGIVSRAQIENGYGKLIVIDHGYGYKTYYGHNSKLVVKVGQRVKRGDLISASGNTGTSTGPHVHYEVRLNGVPLNPRKFI
ncbi:MAG: peptidase M23 [Deltaproteobacteria bacterium HGW-Deltaproteobacteria-4]|nr:MAG: peptidase M23 [Deltaproteobacteria bacterium HGW-Deltaproteobacteria-4]